MAKLKRVKVIIRDEEFNLTPRQLINKLSKLDHWDYEDFFENNPTDNFNHFGCKEELIDQILEDYPNYQPNETDLEHIAKCIIEGYDNGQLIQEGEDD